MSILTLDPRVTVFNPPASADAVWDQPAIPADLRLGLHAAGWFLSPDDPRAEDARRHWPSATVAVFTRGDRWRGFRVSASKKGAISISEF